MGSVLLENCCLDRASLCARCRADTFAHLRGVAACRGEVWAMSLVGRVSRERTWPDNSARVRAIAGAKVADLGTDPTLLEQLAAELERWAARWWATPRE